MDGEKPNYRKLLVWQKAHQNAILAIKLMDGCHMKYSRIIGNVLSAATSIGANIAEGNSAFTSQEKKRYFRIALNSSYEFDNWLQILKDSDIISSNQTILIEVENRNIEVIKLLSKLISNLS